MLWGTVKYSMDITSELFPAIALTNVTQGKAVGNVIIRSYSERTNTF